MRKSVLVLAFAPFVVVACDGVGVSGGVGGRGGGGPFIAELPERVVALAAPYQDLTAVKIDPADGCYVYRHVGPVETTFLPLRATNGRPICTRAPGEEAPAS
jgi:hypothetical protein